MTKLLLDNIDWYGTTSVEVIDLDNVSEPCQLPDFPYKMYGGVGALTSSGPVVCAGAYFSYPESDFISQTGDCFVLQSDGHFVSKLRLQTPRVYASSIVTEDGRLMVIGGKGTELKNNPKYKDSEIVNVHTANTEIGFELPKAISGHCSVRINSTTAMVFGGREKEDVTEWLKSTYFVNLESFEITDGPEMEIERHREICHGATLEHDNRLYVIAAGGDTASTEVLDLTSTTDLRWSKGIHFPLSLQTIYLNK